MAGILLWGAWGPAAATARADSVIDNFDGRSSVAPWTFSNGPEFPGATGSLTLGTGLSGQGAHLAYNLSSGGHYVEANLKISLPATTAAIGFWVRSPPNIFVSLRVTDATGQTLQYRLYRPITAQANPAGWYQQVVELDAPTFWYAGTADGVLHGQITAIGILADDPPIGGPTDAIDFDEVTAISSTALTLDSSTGLIAAPAGAGDLLSGLGVNIHFTSDAAALDAAAAAGFSWVRMDLKWSAVETVAGTYDWSAYDGLVSAVQSRAMHALLILDYGNPLYTGGELTPPTTPAALQAFENFAQAAAAHFAGTGTRFEVWNEPDLSGFWPPASNPEQYAAMSAPAIAAVHLGDPDALVSTAGLAGFDYGFASSYLATGGASGADAIGIHPYDVAFPAGDLVDKVVLLQDLLGQSLAATPPIWDTEWGFSSETLAPAGTNDGHDPTARRQQAKYTAAEILSACAVGFPLYVYYDIRDDGTDATYNEDNFGLLANDYSAKPALTAVQALAAVARNRSFVGFLPVAPTSFVAMRFDGNSDQIVALWTAAPHSAAAVTVPAGATVTDFLGNALATPNGTLAVSESAGPVYIRSTAPARLTNLSVRSATAPGAGELTVGFVIAGAPKSILVRGDGPALASYGVPDSLPEVYLTLFNSASATLATNSGWGGSAALSTVFAQVGAFALAATSLDSALLETLPPGAYTANIVGGGSASGTALAEVYDVDRGVPAGRLTNGSARTMVGTGANIMIAGFTIGGSGTVQLLIRAIGPGLTPFGVAGVLAAPQLTIYDSNQEVIAQAGAWGGSPSLAAAFSAVGAFALPANSSDSAILLSLPAGAYTAQVAGANQETGIALVEIYEMPTGN